MGIRILPNDGRLGKQPFAFLLYLWFLFIQPVFAPTPFNWAVTLGSLAIFLPIYFRNFWVQGAEAVVLSTAMALVGFAVMPVNPGANAYVVFGAAAYAYALRPSRALAAVALLVVGIAVETWLAKLPFWAWLPGVIGCISVGVTNIHFAEQYRHDQQLRRAQEEVEEMAKLAERERIARDLHDLLGHTLSVIVMKSELASKLANRDFTRAIEEIRDVERVSREALTEVRRAVEGYPQHGLGGEMHNAARALQAAGVTLQASIAPLALSPMQETALALALRESITNVVRHAAATVCRVSLRADGGRLTFVVEDDGRGGTPREGNGLQGMRARLAELGGSVAVEGGCGMRVTITLPLTPTEAVLAS
jgi:two-component system sensor histidine kinase DesK